MKLLNEKIKLDNNLWKELLIGAMEGLICGSILFLLIYGYNDAIIDLLQFMNENVDKVWSVYFSFLAIFVVITVSMKLGLFISKCNATKTKKKSKRKEAVEEKEEIKK